MLLLKLGGSLVTDKSQFCQPRKDTIDRFAREVFEVLNSHTIPLVIALGGGSFGNQLPLHFGLLDAAARRTVDIPRMTVCMQRWGSAVCERWWLHDIPAYPFQLPALVSYQDGHYVCNAQPLAAAVQAGLVPIITGDLLLRDGGDVELFSSDRIGELLLKTFRIARAVMLTDVEGVQHMGETVATIDRTNFPEVIRSCGSSSQPDITGGMYSKMRALWHLAERGVESVVCDGRVSGNLQRALLDRPPPGTWIAASGN